MPSVFGLPPDAFCLHLAAESSAAIASNVLLRTPVSRRNASPFSSLTESNLIAAPLWRQRIKPWLIEGYARGLMSETVGRSRGWLSGRRRKSVTLNFLFFGRSLRSKRSLRCRLAYKQANVF